MDDISPQIVDYLERVRSDGKTLRIMRDSPMNSLITLDFSTSSDSDRLRGGPYVGFPDGGGSGNYYARLIQSQVLFWTLLLTILFIMYWNRKVF